MRVRTYFDERTVINMIVSFLGSGNDHVTQARYAADLDGAQIRSFQDALQAATTNGDSAEIRRAAIEFESFFLNQMFSNMRRSVDLFAPEERSNAMDIYSAWFDEKIADLSANHGGIGLADFIYEHMTSFNQTIDVNRFRELVAAIGLYQDDEHIGELADEVE